MSSHGKGLHTLPISKKERGVNLSKTNKVKQNPRLVTPDICAYIANNSDNLTKAQVLECFRLYHKMITDIFTSNCLDETLTVTLPYIGHFHVIKRHGRKKGSTYKLFDIPTELKEDEPSYYILKFKIFNKLFEAVKDKTKYYE